MTKKPIIHIKDVDTNEYLHHVGGILSDEPVPNIGDHVVVPRGTHKTILGRVVDRLFMYGANGDHGNLREIIIRVAVIPEN